MIKKGDKIRIAGRKRLATVEHVTEWLLNNGKRELVVWVKGGKSSGYCPLDMSGDNWVALK